MTLGSEWDTTVVWCARKSAWYWDVWHRWDEIEFLGFAATGKEARAAQATAVAEYQPPPPVPLREARRHGD